jgi:CheY-like chemotaxis protein
MNLKTPVICMTADAIIGAKERYIAEGFDDYLPKPVDSRELEQTLMKYLPQDKVTQS